MSTYNQMTVHPNNIKAAGQAFDNNLPIEWQVDTQIDGIDPAMLYQSSFLTTIMSITNWTSKQGETTSNSQLLRGVSTQVWRSVCQRNSVVRIVDWY